MAAPTGTAGTVKLLLDEMHAPVIAEALVGEGHDVVAVASTPSLRGTPDRDLLAHAAAEDRVIVTENVVDFAALANLWSVERQRHAGLIFTNPKRFDRAMAAYPGDVIVALHTFLANPPDLAPSGVWWL